MARSQSFRRFAQSLRMAAFAEERGARTSEVVDLARSERASRRAFLKAVGSITAAALLAGSVPGGGVRAARAYWPSSTLSRGSYTCYRPGQFTSIAGLEGAAAGRMKFAGEHADNFYSWQGFIEGACLSGQRAANEVLDNMGAGSTLPHIST